ncbi:NADH-quinone oxidoreductase subunit C [Croceicoccus sp. BE223]|uniref:NADH-quinone oxidoreductase subunit C n=1 Tax=Croceicoccus sp. BE223 TaxID=2817716 RepID=UPI00285AAF2C|nr:NADH-quinone oxidoreductase subunit C [Croceicoccus sp. BE223]MDR7103375.1 NADH-quinone oxidoreductase subunit C [Croceicoccus sp. BE223]
MAVLHSAPKLASNEGVATALAAALGDMIAGVHEEHGEILLSVVRDRLADAMIVLRDGHEYQQLMEIAGVDYPSRAERFEVCYCLLSVTRNHRIIVKVSTDEVHPVPTITHIWPNAGWLEREVFDMYGVLFAGNEDLRRILTDYGFEGHPFRKDFPLTGHVELRYSEEDKRVVYQPVRLAQDFRSFDFMSPWEGADYVLPGDEKAAETPPAPTVDKPKTTDTPAQTGAGAATNAAADDKVADPAPAKEEGGKDAEAPAPTEDRPARKPRQAKAKDTEGATDPVKKPRAKKAKKEDGQ